MAHAHPYLVLTEDLKTEYLRDTFSYENHSQNLYKTKRSNKRYRTYIYYILRFVVKTWAVTTLQDKRAFEGYDKSEEDRKDSHVIAKYFHILEKRVYL